MNEEIKARLAAYDAAVAAVDSTLEAYEADPKRSSALWAAAEDARYAADDALGALVRVVRRAVEASA